MTTVCDWDAHASTLLSGVGSGPPLASRPSFVSNLWARSVSSTQARCCWQERSGRRLADWHDWLITRTLLREVRDKLGVPPPADEAAE
jgi:hypothetical protein